MATVEIILIIIGIICVILSLIMSNNSEDEEITQIVNAELTEQQKNKIREQVEALINEEISEISEKTEASLDKISNTKILEMNEYAENVLGEINRNHNETVFLYDMLNEKAKEIKLTVKDVNNAKRQVEMIQSEVKNTGNASSEPDATFDNEAPAYEKAESSDKNAKDIAKERLIALVQKSNEKSRNEDGSLKRSSQAEKLEDAVNNDDKKTEAKDEAKAETEAEVKSEVETKPETKTKTEPVEEQKGENESKQEKEPETVVEKPKRTRTTKSTSTKAKTSADEKKTAKPKTTKKKEKAVKQEVPQNVQFEPGATKNEKILKLDEMGLSVKDIAKQLNLGVGEVKLVIDLYKGGK